MNLLAGAAAVLMTISACGDSGTDEPTEPAVAIDPSDEVSDSTGTEESGPIWSTQTDPVTGREFRCLYGYVSSGDSYAGGPYTWCYEPEEGELP